jgi:hypothetical protein
MSEQEPGPGWDLTVTMLVLLAVALLVFLTFDLWAPHYWYHR